MHVERLEAEAAAALVELERKFELETEVANVASAAHAQNAVRVRAKIDQLDQRVSNIAKQGAQQGGAASQNKNVTVALRGSADAKILVERAEWLSARLSFVLEEALQQTVPHPSIPTTQSHRYPRHFGSTVCLSANVTIGGQVRAAFREWAHGALFLAGMAAAGAPGGVAAALRDARAEKVKLVQLYDLALLEQPQPRAA